MNKYRLELVSKILSGNPIGDKDADEMLIWELATPRSNGTRNIGSSNISGAMKLLSTHIKSEDIVEEVFKDIINELLETNIVRVKPLLLRQKFRIIDGKSTTS